MQTHGPRALGVAVAAAAFTVPANASSLLGDAAEIWARDQATGDSTFVHGFTVGDPLVEFAILNVSGTTMATIDVGSDFILLRAHATWYAPWEGGPFPASALEVRDLNAVGDPTAVISGVTVDFGGDIAPHVSAPGGFPAFSAANVEFGPDLVRMVLGGYEFQAGSWLLINLTFSSAAVPAPLAALAALPLGAAFVARRRR